MAMVLYANVDVASIIFAYPASSSKINMRYALTLACTWNAQINSGYLPLRECFSARITCKHAEYTFLDPPVQTRVVTFMAADELQAKVCKHHVVAIVVSM